MGIIYNSKIDKTYKKDFTVSKLFSLRRSTVALTPQNKTFLESLGLRIKFQ